jgi:hypothetical protein
MFMKMVRMLIQVPRPLKAKLDALRKRGTMASGSIRNLVEQHFATEKPKGKRAAWTHQGGCAMEEDREDDVLMWATLDEETVAHYETRAHAAGRTLNAQLCYELEVNHGLCPPDPGDLEATHRGEIYRRMFTGHPLNG